MIKIDLVTGFLGSGKTTFIRRYARYLMSRGENIAILENDHGAINVDALILNELEDEGCEIETIAGGCDHDCHVRRFRTKLISMGMLGYDRVIVEPSGIYDVDEFFDVLHEEPLDAWYEIANVMTIVDATMLAPGSDISYEARYFLMSQAAAAGALVLSHIRKEARIDPADTVQVMDRIMKEFRCDRQFDEADLIAKDWEQLTESDFGKIASCGYRAADHIKLPIEDDNSFTSVYFLDLPLPLSQMEEKASLLLRDRTVGHVLRVKGFHFEEGKWYELNASGSGMTVGECRTGQELFIVIGENLDREAVCSRLGVADDVWHNGNVYAGEKI